MRHAVSLFALLLMAPSLTACVAQTAPPHALEGSQWSFTGIDGQAPVDPARAQLSFEGDMLSANVGCNSLSGPWRIEKTRLIAGPLIQTRMFCEGRLGEQEQATSALLVAAPEIEIEGSTLTLKSRGHSASLTRTGGPTSHR